MLRSQEYISSSHFIIFLSIDLKDRIIEKIYKMSSTSNTTLILGQQAQNVLDYSTLGVDNYVGFSIRVPIGLQVVTPMVTNKPLLDEFTLFFSSALGSQELAAKRQVIEDALSFGPLNKVPSHHIKSAIRYIAIDHASHFCDDFIQKIMARLLLDQVNAKRIQEELTKQHEAEMRKLADDLKKKHDQELKQQQEELQKNMTRN